MAADLNQGHLVRNIGSMVAFHASTYILALINVPYLTRTLGVADYGLLACTIGVNAYLWLLMDWGFSLGATAEIARARGDIVKIRQIFWHTMTAKALLSIVAIALLLMVAILDSVPEYFYVIFLPGLINILSAVLTVDWLIQGLQRMGVFTIYSIAGRAFIVALTFLLVRGPDDTWIACFLQTFGSLVASCAGFLVARHFLTLGKPTIDFSSSIRQIWDYRHYFLVQSSWIAYSVAAPLLLYIVSGSIAVGLFAGAERITRVAMSLLIPVSTAIYPHLNALIAESQEKAADTAGWMLGAQIALGLALLAFFLAFAKVITLFVLGPQFTDSIIILRCLAVLPLLSGISVTINRQFLIPLGQCKNASRITIMGTGIYLLLLLLLGQECGALGAAISLVVTESILMTAFMTLLLFKEKEFAFRGFLAAARVPARLWKLRQ